MKIKYPYLFFLFLILPLHVHAMETELIKIRSAGSSNNTQIFMTFKEVPTFAKVQKGKRIDIILNTLLSNPEPMNFDTDDKVVKFLTQQKEDKTILTFFLRYEPQKIKLTSQDDTTLVLDILLGNQFTKAYPELSGKLKGIAIVTQQGADYANPYVSYPYANNWRSFFSNYKAEIKTDVPLRFSTPPFPLIDLLPGIQGSDFLPDELFDLASDELWSDMISIILDSIQTSDDQESKKLLALTFGEVLFRLGDYENSFKQLYLLKDKYEDEYVGIAASYLLARLRAEYEDIFIADYEYRNLNQYTDTKFALSPFIYLAQIETAIATNQLERAKKLLQKDDIALPSRLAMIKELRQSDFWFATGLYVKAYVGYQLFEEKNILDQQPYSLNGYCNTLYHQKKFKEASQCFLKLSSTKLEKDKLSLISLKKAMAELHFKTAREMYVIFSSIEDTYPGSVAGFRAAIKKADIRYLSQPSWRKTSAKYYEAFSQKAVNREIAEEAAMKEAIVHHELGNNAKCIDLLLQLLRNFRAGKLSIAAKALLIEVLPKELELLLNDNKYIEALVLAKKNRELFQKNWIDTDLLGLLAKAYHKLSIFEEARKLYLYLLNSAPENRKENYYYPLISILYSQGDYDLVEDYTTRYYYNYPEGTDTNQITLIRLKSLIAGGHDDIALKLLSSPLPQDMQIDEVAASLCFKNNLHTKVIETLGPYWTSGKLQAVDSLFILAESFFQSNKPEKAEQLFKKVLGSKKFSDQARYRLAEIARSKGGEEMSLKLFKEIVETGYDPLWKKLATKELEFHEMAKKY